MHRPRIVGARAAARHGAPGTGPGRQTNAEPSLCVDPSTASGRTTVSSTRGYGQQVPQTQHVPQSDRYGDRASGLRGLGRYWRCSGYPPDTSGSPICREMGVGPADGLLVSWFHS